MPVFIWKSSKKAVDDVLSAENGKKTGSKYASGIASGLSNNDMKKQAKTLSKTNCTDVISSYINNNKVNIIKVWLKRE